MGQLYYPKSDCRRMEGKFPYEPAFGRLKGRFGCLRRDMHIDMKYLPEVICACFILHNYCEINNDVIANSRVEEAQRFDANFQPILSTCHGVNINESGGKKFL